MISFLVGWRIKIKIIIIYLLVKILLPPICDKINARWTVDLIQNVKHKGNDEVHLEFSAL